MPLAEPFGFTANPRAFNTMQAAAAALLNEGFVVTSISIDWDVVTSRKKIAPRSRGWQDFCVDDSRRRFDASANGLAIGTGEKSDVIVVDIDLPAVAAFEELMKEH